LVQNGSLTVGEYVAAGGVWGRVKAITNEHGETIKRVQPGTPAEILGFGFLPEAGDPFEVVSTEREARSMASARASLNSTQAAQARTLTLEEVVNQTSAGGVKELNLVLKADVQGSVEAVRQALENLSSDFKVRLLHSSSGGITESDVLLASASDAIVIGFNVGTEPSAERLANRMGVQIRHYQIIYQLIDDVSLALQGLLEPAVTDVILARVEVREVFPSRRGVRIAGCRVIEGRITRGATVRIMRNDKVLQEGAITSLRHFRDEVNEATLGTECGIILQGFNDFEPGDILEAHRQETARV
jgi:translation initiation factor IF-2